MPTVRVLRPFANGHHDNIVHPGETIIVTDDRARDLGDLVEADTGTKVAPTPANKMGPAPTNKAVAGRQGK